MDSPCDRGQSSGAVVRGVHGGNDREKYLGRADIARCLLSPDVLLASLEGKSVCRCAIGINAHSDQSAWHAALETGTDRHEPGMRATESERHSESLGGAHDNVGGHLSGRREHRKRKEVGRHHRECLACMRCCNHWTRVADPSACSRVAHENPGEVALR